MDGDFKLSFETLNKRQREAVEYIEGPLLVIAGPGTGKTQLLSMRAANILAKTDTDPGSILCLTFTNFAANNMRERLLNLIGPTARGIVVKTFHSFAAEIMELYPEYFWNGAELKTAPDAVQIDIVQRILSSLPLDNPLALRYSGQLTLINDVQSALKLTKEAGFTPEELRSVITQNIKYIDKIETVLTEIIPKTLSIKTLGQLVDEFNNLPVQPDFNNNQILIKPLNEVIKSSLRSAVELDIELGKTTNTGKWKRRWLQNVDGHKKMLDERRRNEWWLALCDVYKTYREQLHGQGYYDYSDMIIEVNNQLESNNDLRAMVQERFLYIQVDEFQDTNAAQLRMANLVASHPGDEGKPNIMAVGDDDQSIFAFNGAELNNMLTFQDSFQDVRTIVLSENYRSNSSVLNSAANIIQHADMRVVTASGLTKDIISVNDNKKGKIKHLKYPTYQHHINMLADNIINDFDSGHRVSVLARQHSTLKDMASALNQKNAPISYELQNNSLDQPLVQSINIVAKAVNAISFGDENNSDYFIRQLLSDDPWEINPSELWNIAIDLRNRSNWLKYLLRSDKTKLQNIAKWLQWLAKIAPETSINIMLEYILGLRTTDYLTSPIRQHYFNQNKVTASYLANISALNNVINSTKEFSDAKSTVATLVDYINFTNLQESLDKPLADTSWFASGNRTIELLTVYKAKGLEYDVVYILDATDSNWSPRRIGRKAPANLPMQPYGESYGDYVRLMYVAATRARHTIYAASYKYNHKGEEILSSPLIEHFETEEIEPTQKESISAIEANISWPVLDTDKQQTLLNKCVDNFQLSASSLIDFLDVTGGGPQHFLERYILKLPEAKTDDMAFGTAIHKALQTAQILTNTGDFSIEKIIKSYDECLKKQVLPLASKQRLYDHGVKLLKNLINEKLITFNKGELSEYSVNNLRLDNALIGGKIDRLEVNDNEIIISDYKTGSTLKSFSTKDKSKAIKAWKHRSQLEFYALLVSNDLRIKKNNKVSIAGQMIYVEAENKEDMYLRIELSQDSINLLLNLIKVVYSHISSLSFPDTRHYSQDIDGINKFIEDLINKKLPLK